MNDSFTLYEYLGWQHVLDDVEAQTRNRFLIGGGSGSFNVQGTPVGMTIP